MPKSKYSPLVCDNESRIASPTVQQNSNELTNSTVLEYIKFCQNISVENANTFFKQFLTAWLEYFDEAIDSARSNQRFIELSAIQRDLRNRAFESKTFFCRAVSEGFVKFEHGTLNTVVDSTQEDSSLELALVDQHILEESISISSICHRMDSDFSELIWAANQRLTILNRGDLVSDASNPFSPIQFCNALRLTLEYLNLETKYKVTAYRVFGQHISDFQKIVLSECNHYLSEKGILPTLKFQSQTEQNNSSKQYKKGDNEISNNVERDDVTSQDEHELELMHTIRSLLNSVHPNRSSDLISPKVIAGEKIRYASSHGVVDALQEMQKVEINIQIGEQAQNFSKPLDIKSVSNRILEQIEARESGNAVAKNDRYIIDLVGMLFEYMLNDENLPDNVKALLSHLHTPFLKIAFLDPDFFEHSEHPVRLLLNALTEAGSRWVDKEGKPSFDLLNKLKGVVRAVLETHENEVKTVADLLLNFRADTKKVIRKQDLMEKRAKEKAEGESRLRTAKIKVRKEIKNLISDQKLPSPVLLFLLKAWTDYMCFVLLRQGDESESWESALKLIRNIIWTLSVKTTEEDQKCQEELSKSIILEARKGLDSISFAKDTSDNLIQALASAINEVKVKREINCASIKEREVFEEQADEKAGVIKALAKKPTPTELDMMEKLKLMEFGSWVEFTDGSRSKVSWYDYRNNEYLLVNSMGQKDRMLSALDFARSMISQEVKIIAGSAKPFFERALKHIVNKLNEEKKSYDLSNNLDRSINEGFLNA